MDKSNIDQYYIQLNIVEEKLEELDKERANQLLDQLFMIKPVRLKWYLVKGKLRWFGLDKNVSRLENDIIRAGYKYGINNLIGIIGSVQFKHAREVIGRYITNGRYYDEALKGISGVTLVPYYDHTEPSYWMYTLKVKNRDDFCKMMESINITASTLHHRSDTHSVFAESKCELPNMDEWYENFVHIPCGWWVDEEIREKIVEGIKKGW